MSQPRVEPVQAPYSDELQDSFDVVMPAGVPPLNIFRTVAKNPRVLSRMVHGGLLDKGSISVADRELVILRTAAVCRAEYEWGVHVAFFAAQAGFSEEQVRDTCATTPDPDLWAPAQLYLFTLVDELHATSTLTDDTWAQLRSQFSEEQLVELVMLAGLYHAVSFTVNAFRVEGEQGASTFPGGR